MVFGYTNSSNDLVKTADRMTHFHASQIDESTQRSL